MIYYKEEKKKLVIPSGFVMIPIDCDEAIEQAREEGYQEGFADGSSATCDTEEGTYSLTDDFDGEETVFPSEGKTGFNKIVIVDDGYGDAKYDEGYADGLADCSGSTPCDCSSAVTEAYQSGITEGIAEQKALLSSTAITSNGTYTSENGWNSVNVNVPRFEPTEEKTLSLVEHSTGPWEVVASYPIGMSKVTVEDNGYGQGKYDEGYADGLADCSGSTDCSSAITEAYQSGYTAGLADCSGSSCTLEEGQLAISDFWNGGPTVVYPFTADGFSQFTVEDTNGSYAHKHYMDGYNDGLAQCSGSSCLIEDEQTASLNYDWTGFTIVYPSQGYDGLGRVLVADLGYGQRKYDEGYADGHTSGYTEGYNEAITANCGTAIEEAYESGYTEGYDAGGTKIYSSSKDTYFDELAWVDVENSTAYSEEDTIMIDYKWGNTVTGSNTIVLFSNESDDPTAANPPSPTTPSFSIVLHTAGLSITTDDGQGNRQIWTGLYRSAQLNHSYRLIVQTYSYTSSVTIKAALIDLTSGQITTGSTNGAFHFTGATSLNYCINGYRNTVDGVYEGMNTDWYLGGIKIFDNTGVMKHNYHFLNGCISDVVNDLETGYEAKYYDNSVETTYSLTGVEETMRFFY